MHDREGLIIRAQTARVRSVQLVDEAPDRRRRWETTFSNCLLTRDRIEQATWHHGARSPELAGLMQRSRERYTRLVGRDTTIDQGKRVLMERFGLSPDDAFALLRTMSQRRNVKLAVIAREVVDSGARSATRQAS
jgi:hypothetical protein